MDLLGTWEGRGGVTTSTRRENLTWNFAGLAISIPTPNLEKKGEKTRIVVGLRRARKDLALAEKSEKKEDVCASESNYPVIHDIPPNSGKTRWQEEKRKEKAK